MTLTPPFVVSTSSPSPSQDAPSRETLTPPLVVRPRRDPAARVDGHAAVHRLELHRALDVFERDASVHRLEAHLRGFGDDQLVADPIVSMPAAFRSDRPDDPAGLDADLGGESAGVLDALGLGHDLGAQGDVGPLLAPDLDAPVRRRVDLDPARGEGHLPDLAVPFVPVVSTLVPALELAVATGPSAARIRASGGKQERGHAHAAGDGERQVQQGS